MPTPTLAGQQALAVQIVKRISAVATLPEITARIITTVEDPRSTAAQLHKIVSHDPALATRLLKVVNSAFYGLPGQIASVERAIVLLGLNAVKNIAVAASLGQLFRSGKLAEGVTAKDLWTHCIAVGVASRDLAKQMRLTFVEEAFLAGMIHDIGILISAQENPEKFKRVCERVQAEKADFIQVEQEEIGVDHQILGMVLAEQWRFPRLCQLVTGYHHRPMSLGEDVRLLPVIVYIADTICAQANIGVGITAQQNDLAAILAQQTNITAEMVEHTRNGLAEMVEVAASVFGGTGTADAAKTPVRKAG